MSDLIIGDLLSGPKIAGGNSLRFRPDAGRALLQYEWPLNVRELVLCLSSSAALAEGGLVTLDDLPPAVAAAAQLVDREKLADAALRQELERRLTETKGNVSEIARAMGKAQRLLIGVSVGGRRGASSPSERPHEDKTCEHD